MSPLGEAPNGPSGEGLEVEEGDQHLYWWAGLGLKVCLFQEGHLPSGPEHFYVLVGSSQPDLMCPALKSFPRPVVPHDQASGQEVYLHMRFLPFSLSPTRTILYLQINFSPEWLMWR